MKTVQRSLAYRDAGSSVRNLARMTTYAPRDSVTSLLRVAGPFDAPRDGFVFTNSRLPILESDAAQLRSRYQGAIDVVSAAVIDLIKQGLNGVSVSVFALPDISLPDLVIDKVLEEITAPVRDKLLDAIVSGIPGTYGRCGGMAFAGYDMFLAGVPVDKFAVEPAPDTPLYRYIWGRLLDSLDANATTFLEWGFELHLLPTISKIASGILGVAIGSLAGPMGSALGGYIAGKDDVLGLGGPTLFVDRTRDHLKRLASDLQREAAWPIGLLHGAKPNPVESHQVLATSLRSTGPNRMEIGLWDNNHGNVAASMFVDLTGSQVIVSSPNADYLDVKAIFREDYAPAAVPAEVRALA